MSKGSAIARTLLLAGAATFALAGTAIAAPFNWSGMYIGVNATGGQIEGSGNNYYGLVESTDWGGGAGATIGNNWMHGAFVFGLVGDIDWTGFETDSGDTYGTIYRSAAEWDWVATIRGRAGVAVDNTVIFVTGGVAVVDTDYRYCYNADCSASSNDATEGDVETGIALGAGTEVSVGPNTTVSFEYLYIGLNTTNTFRVNGDPINFTSSAQTGRIGFNWHF